MTTKEKILKNAKKIFAKESLEGLSMRRLAADTQIALSVIYHYFPGKDDLLKELYKSILEELNTKAKESLTAKTTKAKLKQYLEFCFQNAGDITYCQKYYLSYRSSFKKSATGPLPQATTEILEILLKDGVKLGDVKTKDPVQDAKLLYHMIQGILMEYYPGIPNDATRQELTNKILFLLEKPLLV